MEKSTTFLTLLEMEAKGADNGVCRKARINARDYFLKEGILDPALVPSSKVQEGVPDDDWLDEACYDAGLLFDGSGKIIATGMHEVDVVVEKTIRAKITAFITDEEYRDIRDNEGDCSAFDEAVKQLEKKEKTLLDGGTADIDIEFDYAVMEDDDYLKDWD